jgi:hypothetical protein
MGPTGAARRSCRVRPAAGGTTVGAPGRAPTRHDAALRGGPEPCARVRTCPGERHLSTARAGRGDGRIRWAPGSSRRARDRRLPHRASGDALTTAVGFREAERARIRPRRRCKQMFGILGRPNARLDGESRAGLDGESCARPRQRRQHSAGHGRRSPVPGCRRVGAAQPSAKPGRRRRQRRLRPGSSRDGRRGERAVRHSGTTRCRIAARRARPQGAQHPKASAPQLLFSRVRVRARARGHGGEGPGAGASVTRARGP